MNAVSENGIDEDYIRTTLDKGLLNLSTEELQALKGHLEEHGIRVYNSATPEHVLLAAFVVDRFSGGFIQALGKQAADGAVKRVGDLVRICVRRKGEPDEYRIGVGDDSTATIVITADTPDEARLALLDLDVTTDEVRGKLLRWDRDTSVWCPADDN